MIALCGRRRAARPRARPIRHGFRRITKDEEEELRRELLALRQEHRDLDLAIAAMVDSGKMDTIRIQRLKKRKLVLKDRIAVARGPPPPRHHRLIGKGRISTGPPARLAGRRPPMIIPAPHPAGARSFAMVDHPPPVAILMGSQSDWATMRHAAETLDALGIAHDDRIVSAHRTPDRLFAFAKGARRAGYQGHHRRRRRRGASARHGRRA